MAPMTDAVSPIDPRRAALLVMDYQPAIIGRLPDPERLLERANQAIAAARGAAATVGYVRVALADDDYAQVPASNRTFAAIAASRAMHHEAAETAVDERVAPQPDDIVVRKTRVGAFSTTDLHEQLCERGIDTLILAGISTSGVVLSTVRDAADRDYRVLVLEDASADPDTEVHQLLTGKVFPRQADVIVTDQLAGLLSA
jgi:nicotinamidase-related amidase